MNLTLDDLREDIARVEGYVADLEEELQVARRTLAALRPELRRELQAAAPYPFCGSPEKCIAAHRCMSAIVCND